MCKLFKTSLLILLFISSLASCNRYTTKLDDISNEFYTIKDEMCASLTKLHFENRYEQGGEKKDLDYFETNVIMKKTLSYFDSDESNEHLQKINLLINDYSAEMEKHISTKDKKVRLKMAFEYAAMQHIYDDFIGLRDSYKKYDTLTESDKRSVFTDVIVLLDKN